MLNGKNNCRRGIAMMNTCCGSTAMSNGSINNNAEIHAEILPTNAMTRQHC